MSYTWKGKWSNSYRQSQSLRELPKSNGQHSINVGRQSTPLPRSVLCRAVQPNHAGSPLEQPYLSVNGFTSPKPGASNLSVDHQRRSDSISTLAAPATFCAAFD